MATITFLGDENPRTLAKSYAEDKVASSVQYGAERLRAHGFDLRFSRFGARPASDRRKIQQVIEHRMRMPVMQALASIPTTRRSDLIFAQLEHHAYLPSMLRRAKVPPFRSRPLVSFSCWLAERLCRSKADERQWLISRTSAIDLLIFWSENQRSIYEEYLNFSGDRLMSIPFEIPAEWYTPEPERLKDVDVLAVGADAGRDFKTLIEAVQDTDIEVDLYASSIALPATATLHPNVRVHQPVPVTEYRELLRRAHIVVVPTKELAYPTGQSVALEAMACGACVVATRTGPLLEYLTDDHDSVLVAPGDSVELRNAIGGLLSDTSRRERIAREGRTTVTSQFDSDTMWDSIASRLSTQFVLS